MENTDKRVFLLDAMALIFRAYYALISSPRITSKGRNTNAQFGFTNALIDLINQREARHIITIEDPVEYQHIHSRSLVEQIEIGADALFGDEWHRVDLPPPGVEPDVIRVNFDEGQAG